MICNNSELKKIIIKNREQVIEYKAALLLVLVLSLSPLLPRNIKDHSHLLCKFTAEITAVHNTLKAANKSLLPKG